MNVYEYLHQVADLEYFSGSPQESLLPHFAWMTKESDHQLCMIGEEQSMLMQMLAYDEVLHDLGDGIGYSKNRESWVGWDEENYIRFTVGSVCTKNSPHFLPSGKGEFSEYILATYEKKNPVKFKLGYPRYDGVDGVSVSIDGYDDFVHFYKFPETYGNGEWVAETMEDAKKMAIDLNTKYPYRVVEKRDIEGLV